jgi:transcriptional regulator with XRE-family HTH domain
LHPCNCMGANMACMYADAVEMLKNRADELKLAQVEIADKANISESQVSRIFRLESTASSETLVALAKVVGLPQKLVLQVAGRLDADPDSNQVIERINSRAADLPPDEQEGVLAFIEMRHKIVEQRGKYEAPKKDSRKTKRSG